jgi:hypothetical protein
MESVGEIIDKLITANVKLFWIEEELEKLQKFRRPDVRGKVSTFKIEDGGLLEKISDLDVKRRGMTTRRRLLIIELDEKLKEKNFDFRTV